MICYQCGHQIKSTFAKFCDHCGSNFEVNPKTSFSKKEVVISIYDEINQATNLFVLWNGVIATSFVFYIINIYSNNYTYLFLLVLFMLVLSWMLLLTKLYDLSVRNSQSSMQFILTNFGIPILGTFYSFIKLTQK